MENRITDKSLDDMPMAPERPPVVTAKQVYGWRCPEEKCTTFQLAEKSTTHVAKCRGCGKPFTVDIRKVKQ